MMTLKVKLLYEMMVLRLFAKQRCTNGLKFRFLKPIPILLFY